MQLQIIIVSTDNDTASKLIEEVSNIETETKFVFKSNVWNI